jgi:hypothetical protein
MHGEGDFGAVPRREANALNTLSFLVVVARRTGLEVIVGERR